MLRVGRPFAGHYGEQLVIPDETKKARLSYTNKKTTSWHEQTKMGALDCSGTRRGPFTFTPMAVNSISYGSPHVRPMWALSTCGEPDEIKKNTHPKQITALFRAQTSRTIA